jgi:hypothetical protein
VSGCGQGDHANREAVEQHRHAIRRGGQHRTGQSGELESAQRAEDLEWPVGVGRVGRERPGDDLCLALEALGVESGTPATHRGRAQSGQAGQHGGSGGRVGDPDLTEHQHVGVVARDRLARQLRPGIHRLSELVPAHGRPQGDVGAGVGYSRMTQLLRGDLGRSDLAGVTGVKADVGNQ